MAEELGRSDEIKNEFISSVSHELRTPLTAIKGWAETLNNTGDYSTIQKGTDVILSETDRLYAMVENLLDFSRLQQADMKMTKEKLDLVAEISDAAIMFAPRCRQNGISLEWEETEDIIPVYGDKDRLKQVMVNLLDNSIKYTPAGGKIEISVLYNKKAGTVAVSVLDNGKGIHADDLDKVTQKFYKGKASKRGSGIGLALVKEIINAHGGSFTVDSEYGKYTKMTFELPVVRTMKGK
jgi:signal transduction histidine kinase